ncbi:MAG: hypothetical protein ACRC10_04165 [Thermoguttaceae bacterium]
MKKLMLIALFTVTLSTLSIGCSTTSDWCRRGSIWPFSKPAASTTPVVSEGFIVPQTVCSPMMDPCTPALCSDPCATGPYSTTGYDLGNN